MRAGVLNRLAALLALLSCVSCVGTQENAPESIDSLRELAAKGDAAAQSNLGFRYIAGQGVPQDYAEAVRWCRKAADQGDITAQFNLGISYATGRGVPQDFVEAHMWLNVAASRAEGKDQKRCAEARESAAEKMTSQQIAEAQRRAREWKPKSAENEGGRPTK